MNRIILVCCFERMAEKALGFTLNRLLSFNISINMYSIEGIRWLDVIKSTKRKMIILKSQISNWHNEILFCKCTCRCSWMDEMTSRTGMNKVQIHSSQNLGLMNSFENVTKQHIEPISLHFIFFKIGFDFLFSFYHNVLLAQSQSMHYINAFYINYYMIDTFYN